MTDIRKLSLAEMRDDIPSPFQGEGKGEGAHPRNRKLIDRARRLRKDMTEVEKKLWYQLRSRRFEDYKFRRQYPVGRYVVDFICTKHKLIIELDGGQHAVNAEQDAKRDGWLKSQGYYVLRFWNYEIIENLNGVLKTISMQLKNPHPDPLPEREREKV